MRAFFGTNDGLRRNSTRPASAEVGNDGIEVNRVDNGIEIRMAQNRVAVLSVGMPAKLVTDSAPTPRLTPVPSCAYSLHRWQQQGGLRLIGECFALAFVHQGMSQRPICGHLTRLERFLPDLNPILLLRRRLGLSS